MKKIILASGSPRRRELLEQVGIPFTVMISGVEEKTYKVKPDEVVCELSKLKACDIFNRMKANEDVVVIGADTVVAVDSMILGKPTSTKDAADMIKMIEGRSHNVFTGVTICISNNSSGKEEIITFADKTIVKVAHMTIDDINRYVSNPECMDKAGAYGIQGLFAEFVIGIEGDYNNVVGLPVGRICRLLKEKGINYYEY